MKNIIIISVVCISIISLFAFQQTTPWVAPKGADKLKNTVEINIASLEAGKTIYINECANCHGKKGKGDGPKSAELEKEPGNFTVEKFKQQTDGAIFWKITEGRKPMPSFKKEMTDEKRWQLVNYLRELGNMQKKK